MKMYFTDGIGTPAATSCRLTPMPQSIKIGRVVDDDEIGGIGRADADARAALGAEEDDARPRLGLRLRAHMRRCDQGRTAKLRA